MEKNLNEIYEGLKGDYYVSDAGTIYRKKHDGTIQLIKANSQNKHDKHIAVSLQVCEKNKLINKHFPVRYIVLNAFNGYRGKEYKCRFKDGNTRNVRLSNLEWMLKYPRQSLSFFEILSDNELKVWKEVLQRISDVTVMRRKHEEWLKEYMKWHDRNTIYSKAEYYGRRMEFFLELFKGYLN